MQIFIPVKSTLLKAIKLCFHTNWPSLTFKAVSKHLVTTDATAGGHMEQIQCNLRSTKATNESVQEPLPPTKL